jgi:hypothetical protein
MSNLYKLVNVFQGDKWLGQFSDEKTAKDWIAKQKLEGCTVTKKRPSTAERKAS